MTSFYHISSFYDICVTTREGEGVLTMKLHGLIIIVETGSPACLRLPRHQSPATSSFARNRR